MATNYVANPSAVTDTTGWSTLTNRTLARVTSLPGALPAPVAATTTGYSITAAADQVGAANIQQTASITVPAGSYMASAYIWLPTAYTGTGIQLQVTSFTGIAGTTTANVNVSLKDQWQVVTVGPATPDSGDLSGNLTLRQTSGTWSTGQVIYTTEWSLTQVVASGASTANRFNQGQRRHSRVLYLGSR